MSSMENRRVIMANKKYFFFDYDGTLTIGGTGKITESAKRTLGLLMENGHFVAIATGRIQCDAYQRGKEIGVENIISDGGNGVTIDGQIVSMESMDMIASLTLLEELELKKINWAVSCENSLLRYCKTEGFTKEVKDTYMKTVIWPELDYKKLDKLYKIFVSCSPEREKEIFSLDSLPRVRYNPICLYVEPDDKDAGIMKMVNHIKAKSEDIVVFGDGTNDMKMFRKEWTSIAMGNAREELKERASFVTRSSEEDGIEYACKYFGWI